MLKVKEISKEEIIISGDTDDEFIDIIKATEDAICKVAPDCGVTIKVSFGIKED